MGSIPVRVTKTKGHSFGVSFCFGDALRARTHPKRTALGIGFESRAQSDVSLLNGGKPESADDGNAVSRIPVFCSF